MSSTDPDASAPDSPRQRIVRVRGARRAQLTPVAGSDPDPEMIATRDAPAPGGLGGPNDERMRQDVPPHY
ncbi:MAG: hypothetical protein J0I43_00170 [Microbacterium sp.]|uniref:hypothetical protein n=1 Tax=Microbacterium sp. TaxID=51671 RepID=UPI001AD242D9|nr:hypothetical protein [Microbacterium sp.]MBN9175775.1 hypothetical protein [Microbacterium sp.]